MQLNPSIITSTVKFINEIIETCFSASALLLKVDQISGPDLADARP